MDRTIRVFDNFADADAADRAQYAAMTPQERLDIVLELSARHRSDEHNTEASEDSERLARVYRVTELRRC